MSTLLTILLTILTTFCSRWHVEAITPSVSPQTGTSSPGVRSTVARSEVGPRLTRGITISHAWSHSSQGASCYKLSHPSQGQNSCKLSHSSFPRYNLCSTPRKVSASFGGRKVVGITCGQTSSMAVLENGEVFDPKDYFILQVLRFMVGATMEMGNWV